MLWVEDSRPNRFPFSVLQSSLPGLGAPLCLGWTIISRLGTSGRSGLKPICTGRQETGKVGSMPRSRAAAEKWLKATAEL